MSQSSKPNTGNETRLQNKMMCKRPQVFLMNQRPNMNNFNHVLLMTNDDSGRQHDEVMRH